MRKGFYLQIEHNMIVPNMTEKETTEEIKKDIQGVVDYTTVAVDSKWRRDVIKAKQFPLYRKYTWKSRRGNRWTIIYEARSKKDIGDLTRMTMYVQGNFNTKYVFMPSWMDGKLMVLIYPAHFFSRFAERCGIDLPSDQLLYRFFKHNNSFVYDVKQTAVAENEVVVEVHGSTKEGVALGYYTAEGNILMKTFITYPMLKGEQIDTFTANERIRQEIHDKGLDVNKTKIHL